jgi:hypothetical protein
LWWEVPDPFPLAGLFVPFLPARRDLGPIGPFLARGITLLSSGSDLAKLYTAGPLRSNTCELPTQIPGWGGGRGGGHVRVVRVEYVVIIGNTRVRIHEWQHANV